MLFLHQFQVTVKIYLLLLILMLIMINYWKICNELVNHDISFFKNSTLIVNMFLLFKHWSYKNTLKKQKHKDVLTADRSDWNNIFMLWCITLNNVIISIWIGRNSLSLDSPHIWQRWWTGCGRGGVGIRPLGWWESTASHTRYTSPHQTPSDQHPVKHKNSLH